MITRLLLQGHLGAIRALAVPERGMTLLPPWLQAILQGGKRLENRGASVAHRIGSWRGLIALSQSKEWDREEEADTILSLLDDGLIERGSSDFMRLSREWAGQIVGVAELVDVRSPSQCAGHPWHAEGQWGLILGRVWEVEPVPIMGGRGCWYAGKCKACGTLQARDSLGAPCRRCTARPPTEEVLRGSHWQSPELKILRECVA